MRLVSLLLLAAVLSPSLAQQKITASGVFLGRSGKPMAKARLILAEIKGDNEVTYAKIVLPAQLPTATADASGAFQFTGLSPGEYTILYQPTGGAGVLPASIDIKALIGVTKSIAPLLRGTELGTGDPYASRPWGGAFTILKGHTFHSEGPYMRIWNATIRRGQEGPFLEMRKGVVWSARLDGKSPIKFSAWGY